MFERNFSRNNVSEEKSNTVEPINTRVKLRPSPLVYPQETHYGTFANVNKNRPLAITDVQSKNNNEQNFGDKEEVQDQHTRMSLWEYVTSPQSPLVQIRDHCHQQWVAVVVTIFLLIWCIYFVFVLPARSASFGSGANNKCTTPFGTWLGSNRGVAAYSNCNRNYVASGHPSHGVLVGFKEVYTGWEWVSIEYARRYWVMRKLITFAHVETPSEIFNLTSATGAAMNTKKNNINIEHYYNHHNKLVKRSASNVIYDDTDDKNVYIALSEGNKLMTSQNEKANQHMKGAQRKQITVKGGKFVIGTSPMLREGDIIVYGNNEKSLPGGHVSVVVSVNGPLYNYSHLQNSASNNNNNNMNAAKRDNKAIDNVDDNIKDVDQSTYAHTNVVAPTVVYYTIEVAEQNWDNEKWEDKIGQSAISRTTTTQLPEHTVNSNTSQQNKSDNDDKKSKNRKGKHNEKEKKHKNNKHSRDKHNSSEESPTESVVESTTIPAIEGREINEEVSVRRTYARTLLLQISSSADNSKTENNMQTGNSQSKDDNIIIKEVYSLYDEKAYEVIGWIRPSIK